MPPPGRPTSFTDVLDAETTPVPTPVAAPSPAVPVDGTCGAPHHTDPRITCQRPADHSHTAAAGQDLHAAKRLWNDGDTDPTWATWA